MTDIKQVSDWALTIAAEAAGSKLHHYERMADDNRLAQSIEAHARAIERHEAFRQEVSDAVEDLRREWPEVRSHIVSRLSVFIIAKPDPLVEALNDLYPETSGNREYANELRAALAARGLEVRKIGEGE